MPTINLIEKKERKRYKQDNKRFNLNNVIVYNTTIWRDLRITKLMLNPLCEDCLKRNYIKCAVEVHHINPISTVSNIIDKKRLGFDINNLKSLCNQCHKDAHNKMIEND